MDDLLQFTKIILLIVLLYDVAILFRKPEPDSKIITLDFWKERLPSLNKKKNKSKSYSVR